MYRTRRSSIQRCSVSWLANDFVGTAHHRPQVSLWRKSCPFSREWFLQPHWALAARSPVLSPTRNLPSRVKIASLCLRRRSMSEYRRAPRRRGTLHLDHAVNAMGRTFLQVLQAVVECPQVARIDRSRRRTVASREDRCLSAGDFRRASRDHPGSQHCLARRPPAFAGHSRKRCAGESERPSMSAYREEVKCNAYRHAHTPSLWGSSS